MKTNRKIIIFLSIILVISLLPVSPASFSSLFSYAEIDSEGTITGTEIWDQDKVIDSSYTVQSGATLIIKNGVTINFTPSGSITVYGRLYIKGTVDKLVKIKRDGDQNNSDSSGYSIMGYNGSEINVRNADISGGGTSACQVRGNDILNTAYACYWFGAIHSDHGKLDIQNVSFHDNYVGLSVIGKYNGNPYDIRVNRSEFVNNSMYDVYASGFGSDPNFRYNWWGKDTGPAQTCENGSCWYEKIEGKIDFSDWRKVESFHDPVIIVPGIMGSWKWTDNGDWEMDPIFKTYDSLYDTFKENGYTEGRDLFVFPYQWRASNVATAKLLQEKIKEITTTNNWPKVDVVAHSMGGLVTRQYIESANYQGDIDQLVMLGTPNKGAPKDYLVWEGGALSFDKMDIVGLALNEIFYQEAKEDGFENIFNYLHNKPIKSVQELLPDYDYLHDVSPEKLRSYANNEHYPKNIFLDNLNLPTNLQKLNEVSVINVVGETDVDTTITGIKVGKPSIDEDSEWAHGEPVENGLIMGKGDGTVPSALTEKIHYDEQIETNYSHMQLPGKAQNIIYQELTGHIPQKEMPLAATDKVLFFFALSPIDLQVIDKNNNWAGKNIKGLSTAQIKDSFYSSADLSDGSKNPNEFVTIPNPDGEYTIVTEGTGDGEYTVEVANISEDENNPGQAKESTLDITGTAVKNKIIEAAVTVSGDEVTLPEAHEMTPVIFRAKVEGYYQEGLIKSKQARNVLLSGMKLIEDENRLLKMIEANPFIHRKTKKLLIAIVERGMENQLDAMIKLVKKDKKNYTLAIKDVLIEDLKFIKENL